MQQSELLQIRSGDGVWGVQKAVFGAVDLREHLHVQVRDVRCFGHFKLPFIGLILTIRYVIYAKK